MNIKCPECGATFSIDDDACSEIIQQIRNEEFQKELNAQRQTLEETEHAKENELVQRVRVEETQKHMQEQQNAQQQIATLQNQITDLRGQLTLAEKNQELAVTQAVDSCTKKEEQKQQELQTELDYYKNLKLSMSTKAVGESLEQYCMNEFNKQRMAAYPNAYFEKDNEVSKQSGSKGDFIFRDFTDDGLEYVSIMFDMKNEMDTTAMKHKNEDFFRELDKDRTEKNCEYAVLVSMLEADNEYYNAGITDVSYRYPKMYVVRPQCFMTIISLIRNMARNTIESKQEVAEYQSQNVDFIQMENNIKNFQAGVDTIVKNFQGQYDKMVKEIDSAIVHLQRTRDALMTSETHVERLESKSNQLSLTSLTKNAPSMRKEAKRQKANVIDVDASENIE